MSKIEFFTCKNGHKYLPTEKCPFCCALNGEAPTEDNPEFQRIYEAIKGKSADEIEKYYQEYLPWEEPEKNLNSFMFE